LGVGLSIFVKDFQRIFIRAKNGKNRGSPAAVTQTDKEHSMKKYTVVVVSLFSLVIGVAGCASQGNRTLTGATQENVAAKIEIGKTSIKDAKGAYGDPISKKIAPTPELKFGPIRAPIV
jgi:hypothetical protein